MSEKVLLSPVYEIGVAYGKGRQFYTEGSGFGCISVTGESQSQHATVEFTDAEARPFMIFHLGLKELDTIVENEKAAQKAIRAAKAISRLGTENRHG